MSVSPYQGGPAWRGDAPDNRTIRHPPDTDTQRGHLSDWREKAATPLLQQQTRPGPPPLRNEDNEHNEYNQDNAQGGWYDPDAFGGHPAPLGGTHTVAVMCGGRDE